MKKSLVPVLVLLIVVVLVMAGCRESQQSTEAADDMTIDLQLTPDPPAVGDATLMVTLQDADGEAITDATVEVHGDMNHAGMVPVQREVSENQDGVYEVPFEWTMGGDWILTITATLADGTTVERTFDVTGVSSEDGSGMDMDGMDMDMPEEMTPEATPEATDEAQSASASDCGTPEPGATDDGSCDVTISTGSPFNVLDGNN